MDHLLKTEAPLCRGFNDLMLEIARDALPGGWDAIEGAPDTLSDLKDHYARTGRIAVNVNSRFGLTTGDPEAYYAFRAWHDLLHVLHDEGDRFTIPGERRMARLHREEIVRRIGDTTLAHFYADLIQVEVDVANDLYVQTGQWPEAARQFAIGWLLGRGWAPGAIKALTNAALPVEPDPSGLQCTLYECGKDHQ